MTAPSASAPEGRDRPEAEERTVLPARDARQAVTGHNVRYVLGVGLAAVIVIFGILWVVYFA
jgi:hypothetical protein